MSIRDNIRRGEGPVWGTVRRVAKGVRSFHLPVNAVTRPVFRGCYRAHVFARESVIWARRFFWSEPLFRGQCESVGVGLRMEELPYIQGAGRIVLGERVRLSGKPNISFGRPIDGTPPELVIGDGTFVGHNCGFNAGRSIRIGKHCLFATGVLVYDLDGHPLDAARRRAGEPSPPAEILPVVIGDDVWVGSGGCHPKRRDRRRPGGDRGSERGDEGRAGGRGRGRQPGPRGERVAPGAYRSVVVKLAAVTGCDAKFVFGAKTLLRDVKKFHPDVARYCVTPAADAEAVAAELGDLAEVFPAPRPIRVIPDKMQPALLKLFTPLVPAEVAVWIDCDMILCRPAPELWDVKPGEVVAVTDTAYKLIYMVEPSLRPQFETQFPAIVEGRGFNGGLFALRTAEWRDLPERYEAAFEAGGYSFHPKIWDQPFLNGLMQPTVRYLPYAFNAHHVFDYRIPRDVRLVHFTNVPKPWMPNYPKHEPAYYYWVRYGTQETRAWPLLRAKARIWVHTPKRLVGRFLKSRSAR